MDSLTIITNANPKKEVNVGKTDEILGTVVRLPLLTLEGAVYAGNLPGCDSTAVSLQ